MARPAEDSPEIKITPAMIRAGANLLDAQLGESSAMSVRMTEALVRDVIEAALREGHLAYSLVEAGDAAPEG